MYCISYSAGSYGNFVAWALEWMAGKYDVNYRPFDNQHTSHNWKRTFRTVDEAIKKPINNTILHPITHKDDKLEQVLIKLKSSFDKIVLLYPKEEDFLWSMNNKQHKVYKKLWTEVDQEFLQSINENYKNPQKWQIREHLSLWLYDQHLSETKTKTISKLKDTENVKTISTSDLKDNFITTMKDLSKYLNTTNTREDSELKILHTDWCKNEIYMGKDMLVNNIVDAILNNKEIEMTNLTIIDESQIQRLLRKNGYKIKCYGLDDWPKTTTKLRELLYV